MAASAACSHPHVFAHTLRFSARGFLALTKNAWFLEVPFRVEHPIQYHSLAFFPYQPLLLGGNSFHKEVVRN